ncbi:TetR/AcrR family transcriptional regulator [Paenibacillus sp. HW567]|uniref:TetR/AcrR family transcriptional regulator n=1 Tax=Paenibacillus sp. HW567 TaxID=1034769 RepID=UPI00037C8197|nr:TetR/AcrR family transcriptional regulator [Paenibacillus sp. HW567]
MSKPLPRTDPRVLRTRKLIQDAFVELLQETDMEKITVNRIAERATINRVTFYLHYKDIPDMLEKMADEMISDFTALLDKTPDHSPSKERHWAILVQILERIAERSNLYKALLGSRRLPVFTERLVLLIIDFIKKEVLSQSSPSGQSHANVPADILAWYSSTAFIGTIVFWLRNDMPYTPSYLVNQLSLLAPFASGSSSP